jgi:hypothetical protein
VRYAIWPMLQRTAWPLWPDVICSDLILSLYVSGK